MQQPDTQSTIPSTMGPAEPTNTQTPQPQPEIDPEELAAEQAKIQAEEEERQEALSKAILSLMKIAEKEDEDLRWPMLRRCKRNEYYFQNIQKIYFDEVARDYRTIDNIVDELANFAPIDDIKTINIYRAYAESLVAALSVSEPSVEFSPDDAENPDDIQTADAYTRISSIVKKHNNSNLLAIKALTLLFNQGTIAAFNYYKTDPAYGTFDTPGRTEQKPVKKYDVLCPACADVKDTNLPETSLASIQNITCETCGYQGKPSFHVELELIDEVVEWEKTPKGRACFDVFGITNVKIPLYARKQSDCGYIILRIEDHVAKWKAAYEDYADQITQGGGDTYTYERWSRIPPEYFGTIPKDITTGRFAFFRPWFYNVLGEEDAALLKGEYPKGLFATAINEVLVDHQSEDMDDRWTISFDPRSNFLHAEPAGNALIPLQDSENDLFNLGLQSIEYGIPETFAHPKTLNLQSYSKTSATPGMISPAVPPGPDKALSDGFHTIKAATLSNEYTTFQQGLRSTQQFVTGAFPSLFGGDMNSGSGTATEYTESRARALQRLQLTWQMMSTFWSAVIYKTVRDFADNLKFDENFVQKQNGSYVNIWIRKSELQGKVGQVNPETNTQLPQSWAQKKDFIMGLIKLQDPLIGQILLHPNNSESIKQIVGMPEFYIPGENDRSKQYQEYYLLSQGQPNGNQPSIPVDIDVDDHAVHMSVLKNILVSAVGVNLYQTNPAGYQNNIMHYRMHEMANQAKTQAPAGLSGSGEKPETATQNTQG